MLIKALPVLVQGAFLLVDELYCHRRRTLRRWERLGHPVDTLAFLACVALLLLLPVTSTALVAYSVAAVFSCVLITKDEWQHRELCSGFENWLHSVLFMLHPVVLGWLGYLWWRGDADAGAIASFTLVFASVFFLYQIVYWNIRAYDRQ